MSVRIWLKRGQEIEIVRLQSSGELAQLKIQTHNSTGKKYVKLGASLADPTEEIPQIPQGIIERVTFKGKVQLLGQWSYRPFGSYHSEDMFTHMIITGYCQGRAEVSIPGPDAEVSISGPDIVSVKEMLKRLALSGNEDGYNMYITRDEQRDTDQKENMGCFEEVFLFPVP